MTTLSVRAQKTITLYEDSVPNTLPGPDQEYSKGEDLQIFNVRNPTLTVYLPSKEKSNGAAVIICPGGGYGSLVINREGHDVAKAFVKKGIAAFVLKYRLPSASTMRERSIGPLQDAQQAIMMVRKNAGAYNIDTARVGIMGFSAGGHLAAMAGIKHEPSTVTNVANIDVRPNFMILVYPVITMDTLKGHKGSTYNLLGAAPTAALIDDFSAQLHVDASTSPAYIAVAGNDDLLSSSMMLYDALHKYRVPAELHIYSTGGHGFLKYPTFDDWTYPLFKWLELNKWTKKH